MATGHDASSSFTAAADVSMQPGSPVGSEADWDFVGPSPADAEAEFKLQSDDLRVQELAASMQLLPVDKAHPSGVDEESSQQMADKAGELSPISSTTIPYVGGGHVRSFSGLDDWSRLSGCF